MYVHSPAAVWHPHVWSKMGDVGVIFWGNYLDWYGYSKTQTNLRGVAGWHPAVGRNVSGDEI